MRERTSLLADRAARGQPQARRQRVGSASRARDPTGSAATRLPFGAHATTDRSGSIEELTADVILAAEVANDPQICPDGTRVVWTAQAPSHEGEHPTSTLWLAAVAADATGRRFSSDGEHLDGHEVTRVADAPLGTNLVWCTTEAGAAGRLVWSGPHEREPQCGAAIWSVDANGGHATLETADETVCEIGLTASADGRAAVVTVADGLGTRLRWLGGGVAHDEPDGDLRGVAVHRDGDRSVLALVRGTASEPWELWVAVDGDLHRVSDHQDARLPVNQAIGFGRALRESGVDVEQVVYPREPHGPRERNHHRDLHHRLRAWFDRWLLDGQEVR